MPQPTLDFAALPAADGSVSYSSAGYTLIASANGPLEAQRRDERPNEAYLEVIVREASGVGGTSCGPRERLLETMLHQALAPLVLIEAHPRTLIQLTCQVLQAPDSAVSVASVAQHISPLRVLPHLFNAAISALLDGNIAMKGVAVATEVACDCSGAIVSNDLTRGGIPASSACHVFAFSGEHKLLMAESEGECSLDAWREAALHARKVCCGGEAGLGEGLLGWLRETVAKELKAKSR